MITTSVFIFNFQATEDGCGSPVDVAKSYMRARLPWGSPAVNNSEFQSPSPAGMQLLKEGTPFSYSAGNFSSSKVQCIPVLWSNIVWKSGVGFLFMLGICVILFPVFKKKSCIPLCTSYVSLKVMHMHSDFGYKKCSWEGDPVLIRHGILKMKFAKSELKQQRKCLKLYPPVV